MDEKTKWFNDSKEAREYFIGESRSHGVVFEPKEVKKTTEETKKKKTGSKKKVEQNE